MIMNSSMLQLVFATNNQHKVDEMRTAIGNFIGIMGLKESGLNFEIPEPHNTLEKNALEKSRTVYVATGKNCFSEDTGLAVHFLNGEPGVRSARYAGPGSSAAANIDRLLRQMADSRNRDAEFRTVISLILEGNEFIFHGICPGSITRQPRGNAGFGYDPVFVPNGADKTFAEMSPEEKNIFSHRRKAADELVRFLQIT